MCHCLFVLHLMMKRLSGSKHCTNSEEVPNSNHSETESLDAWDEYFQLSGHEKQLNGIFEDGKRMRDHISCTLINQEAIPCQVFRMVATYEKVLKKVRQ